MARYVSLGPSRAGVGRSLGAESHCWNVFQTNRAERSGKMAHKVYISFKAEDLAYKDAIQAFPHLEYVDKSLNTAINSNDEDYILQTIRSQYLADSTVTIHLIGLYGAESRGAFEQRFIKRELQASLYHGQNNTKSGILGVVLPAAMPNVFRGSYECTNCGGKHNSVQVNDQTTIREFSANYYIPNGKCAHTEEERYCVLVGWEEFAISPNIYIDQAFDKRTEPISGLTRVRP